MDELSEEINSHVATYHSETDESIKETILSSIREEESPTRVIISTNALGMGVDFKDVLSSIILFGPPHSILDVLQEIGRAGRDGEKTVAILLYNSHHPIHCEQDVKNLFKCNDCRRIQMMKSFLKKSELEVKSYSGDCSCCDICENTCSCGNCILLPLEKMFSGTS